MLHVDPANFSVDATVADAAGLAQVRALVEQEVAMLTRLAQIGLNIAEAIERRAVAQAQRYVAEGYEWVVDIDLEKFFDRVNHDILMDRVAKRISDKRLLRLIRAYLNAGVMADGLVSPTDEGVPQGGPLSPLLSNLVLDEFDKSLELGFLEEMSFIIGTLGSLTG